MSEASSITDSTYFDDVLRQLGLSFDEALNHLVEVIPLEAEHVEDPGEGHLRAVFATQGKRTAHDRTRRSCWN